MTYPQYQTLKEKELIFAERYARIDTIEQLLTWHKSHDVDLRESSPFVFRGVESAKYKNYTTAQRFLIEHDEIKTTLHELIEQHIQSLRQSKHSILSAYCNSTGVPQTDLFLLSFSQHYGGISPLLDFTESVNTSLFFMIKGKSKITNNEINSIENYMSIYFFDTKNSKHCKTTSILSDEIMHQYPYGLDEMEDHKKKEIELKKKLNSRLSYDNLQREWSGNKCLIISNLHHGELVHGEPFYNKLIIANLNSVSQSGVFVFNERGMDPLENDLWCVDVHKSLSPFIRKHLLSDKRYSYKVLFPSPKTIVKEAQQFTESKIENKFTNRYPLNDCTIDEIMDKQHISR